MSTKSDINLALRVIGENGFDPAIADTGSPILGLKLVLELRPVQNYSNLLRELKRQNLINVSSSRSITSFTLTPAGAQRLQKSLIDDIKIPKQENWDQKWRLISFDIPLSHSSQRLQFTKHLRRLDFYMLQRSNWFIPYPCQNQLEQIAGYYNLWRYCAYMEVSHLDSLSEAKLRRHFF